MIMMKKQQLLHLMHYLILVVILGIGLVLFWFFTGLPNRQYAVVIAISSLYFLWGIFHHLVEGDLHGRIVVEYLLIALMAVVLLRGVIYR